MLFYVFLQMCRVCMVLKFTSNLTLIYADKPFFTPHLSCIWDVNGQTSLWSCFSSHPPIINTKHTDLSCCRSITTDLTHSLISPDIIQKCSHIFFMEEYQRLIIDFSRSSDFISSWWRFELLATKTERCVMQRRL